MEKLNGMFRGVIEDNNDPLKQGRCKLRVFGVHSPKITEMKTVDLPWAEQASPFFVGSMQGIGINSVPVNGAWVWVFFEKGEISKPVYFASMMGGPYSDMPDSSVGFRDSFLYSGTNQYTYPRNDRLDHQDMNKLCTATSLNNTAHTLINDNVMSADGMSEPQSTNNLTAYPHNNVIETQSGHILEFDDTKGNERVRLFHKSGSYEEIRPSGDRTLRTNGKYIICTTEDINDIVAKSVQRYIGSNLMEHIVGNVDLVVDGNVNWKVNGEIRIKSNGVTYMKGSNVHFNPPFGFAEPALTNSGIVYNTTLLNISIPQTIDTVDTAVTIDNKPREEVTGGETEELAPVESPVTNPACTNPWTVAWDSYNSVGQAGWKENGANKNILALWEEIGQPKKNDQTAWCACFLSATLKRAKCKFKPTPSSQAYSSYGQAVSGWAGSKANWDANVQKGDILVFSHGGGSGHVGFYNGDSSQYPKVGLLGGNQSNTLKTLYFSCTKTDTPMKLIAVRRALCEDGSPVGVVS